jgi:hypothetical protein
MLDLSKFFFGEQMPVVAPPATDSVMADYEEMMNYTNQMMSGSGGGGIAGAPVQGFLGGLAQMGGQKSFLQPEAPAGVSAASGFAMGPQLYQQEVARQQERNIQAAQLRAEEDKQRQHHQFLSEIEKGRQRMKTQKMLIDMKDRQDQMKLKEAEFDIKERESKLNERIAQYNFDQAVKYGDAPTSTVSDTGLGKTIYKDGRVETWVDPVAKEHYLSMWRAQNLADDYMKHYGGGTGGGVGGRTAPVPESGGEYGVGADGATATQKYMAARESMIDKLMERATGSGTVADMDEVYEAVNTRYPLSNVEYLPKSESELTIGDVYVRTNAGFVKVKDGTPIYEGMELVQYFGPGNLRTIPAGASSADTPPPPAGASSADTPPPPAGTEAAPTAQFVRNETSGKIGTIENGRFTPFRREKNIVLTQGISGMGMYGRPGSFNYTRLDINDPEVRYDRNKHVFHKGHQTIIPAEPLITGNPYKTSSGETMFDVGGKIITEEELNALNDAIRDRHTPLRQQGAKNPGKIWDEEVGRWLTEEEFEEIQQLRGKK